MNIFIAANGITASPGTPQPSVMEINTQQQPFRYVRHSSLKMPPSLALVAGDCGVSGSFVFWKLLLSFHYYLAVLIILFGCICFSLYAILDVRVKLNKIDHLHFCCVSFSLFSICLDIFVERVLVCFQFTSKFLFD